MNSQSKGYSLIELLVAMSILGILTGIAVPSYNRYKRSSKTVEAKVSLSQIYMAEKHFFIQWRFYTHDLLTAGVSPEGELLYNAGFPSGAAYPAASTDEPHYQGADIEYSDNAVKSYFGLCGQTISAGRLTTCGFLNDDNSSGFTPPNIPSSAGTSPTTSAAVAKTKFTAFAIADLKNKKPTDTSKTNKDIWSINQYRKVRHNQDGS